MTTPRHVPRVVRPFLLVAPALLGLVLLAGCEGEGYSESVEYRVRTDPIVLDKLPGEYVEPDRPGQLPLLSAGQFDTIADLFSTQDREQARGMLLDPMKASEQDRKTIGDTLEEIFGRPAQPRLKLKGTEGLAKLLRVGKESTEQTLAHGSRVYRIQCQMCHGVTGDGRGPTAPWVNPHPRDYRMGLFKFQSVDQTSGTGKPLLADLVRVIHNGVEGTAMPAFNVLQDPNDIEALARYVVLLSLRGQAEMETFKELLTGKRPNVRKRLREFVAGLAGQWEESQGQPIQAGDYPKYNDEEMRASVQRGAALFRADLPELKRLFPKLSGPKVEGLKVGCISCHVDYGRQAPFKFDSWGTMTRPADLTTGVYRGGRRPIDLYWRIHSGINGTAMPSFGGSLSGEQIWDVVNFVRALPYPGMRERYKIEIH